MVSKLIQFLYYKYLLTIIRNDHDFTLNTPHKFECYKIKNKERGTGNGELGTGNGEQGTANGNRTTKNRSETNLNP